MNKLENMTDSDYFSVKAISNSFLKKFDVNPATAFLPSESTPAMAYGTMFHEYILQPDVFKGKYLIVDKIDKRTSEYKKIVADNPDKIIVNQEDIDNLSNMRKNVYETVFEFVELSDIIENSEKEISCFSELMGIQAKGKFDLFYQTENQSIIFDLKKCQDAKSFQKDINNYQYYRQAAFYHWLLENEKGINAQNIRFIFIAVEEQKPNGVILYELDEAFLHYAEMETVKSVKNYAEWKDRNGSKDELYKDTYKLVSKPNWLN